MKKIGLAAIFCSSFVGCTGSEISTTSAHQPLLPKYDLVAIEAAIEQIAKLKDFHGIADVDKTSRPERPALPDFLIQTFNALSDQAFNHRRPLALKNCGGDCKDAGGAEADVQRKIIYFDDNHELLRDLESGKDADPLREEVNFTLAHEISHYLLELAVDISRDKRTPNGSPSLLRNRSLQGSHEEDLRKAIEQGSIIHAEVDAFGYVLLQKTGLSTAGARRFLQKGAENINKSDPYYEMLEMGARLRLQVFELFDSQVN